MRYMLLCYDDEQAWEQAGEAAHREAMQDAVELTRGRRSSRCERLAQADEDSMRMSRFCGDGVSAMG